MMLRSVLASSALLATTSLISPALADDPLRVVASFSILGDMVEVVGGDAVAVTTIVGRGEDAHVYEPVPTDAANVAEADLIFVNGLSFEGSIERLIEASGTTAPVAVASVGINVLMTDEDDHSDHSDHDDHDDHNHDEHAHDDHDDDHDHDDHDHDEHAHDDDGHDDHDHDEHAHDDPHDHDHGPEDPHAWQSLDAAQIYAANIADALCDLDADSCETFEANAAAYGEQLEALHQQYEAQFSDLEASERVFITAHQAFGYLARDFDFTILSPQGLSTESEASAADVARLIDQIRETGAQALFVAATAAPRLLEQIASETGVSVSDTPLYSDWLSDEDGPAATYLAMMTHNLNALVAALVTN
ncbi:MAG: metal ABC transporter solute-binding protein, Zn/Mn family [Cohaesibacteraceae bacterium]